MRGCTRGNRYVVGELATLRGQVVDALRTASAPHTDWAVLDQPVDGLTPPAFIVMWSEPMLFGPTTSCVYSAGVDIRIVSTRVEPGVGLDVLELMVETAVSALVEARHPIRQVSKPAPYDVDGVRYQSVVALCTATVSITQPALLAASNGGH